MTRELSPMQEELLEQVVVGDLDEFHPSVQKQVAKSTAFAVELREMLAISQQLDALGVSDGAGDEAYPAAPELEQLVEGTLRPLIEEGSSSESGRGTGRSQPDGETGTVIRRWPWGGALAIAAALLIAFFGPGLFGGEGESNVTLGTGPGTIEPLRNAEGLLTGASWFFEEGANPGFDEFEVILQRPDGSTIDASDFISTFSWTTSASLDPQAEIIFVVKPYKAGIVLPGSVLKQTCSVQSL